MEKIVSRDKSREINDQRASFGGRFEQKVIRQFITSVNRNHISHS